MHNTDYVHILNEEFEIRRSSNPSYSLRAFARDIDIRPSQLSSILNSKAGLGSAKASDIAKNLGFSETETKVFLALVDLKHAKSKKISDAAKKILEETTYSGEFKNLSVDGFKFISDWIYFAILSTMELDDYNGKPSFIATSLGLEISQVEEALKVMLKLDIVDYRDSKFIITGEMFTTTHDLASRPLRKFHKQNLHKSMDALDDVPVELRDITTMTMAIDKEKLPEAKKRIRDFRRSLCKFLEGGAKNEVYNINIQLIPLSKVSDEKVDYALN